MKLIWLTDIHLNFLDKKRRFSFYQDIVKTNLDSLLITGDIAEAPSVSAMLQEMCSQIKKPIYFVLGNHDYYRGQVSHVRKEMALLTSSQPLLHWLPDAGPVILGNQVVLVGQEGWADGRLGDYQQSHVSLNDSRMIVDLFQEKILGKNQLLKKMQQLADQDAQQLRNDLKQAILTNPKKIIVLTHIPPFKEACLYEGNISDNAYLPFFSSKATGDALMSIVIENPVINFLVLCGHTHHECFYQPRDNLIVRVGGAEYLQPKIQDCIVLP